MPTLRDIRRKINSIKSTQTITRTMKMVASSRLRRSQDELEKIRPYALKMNELKNRLVASVPENIHPLLKEKEEVKNVLIFACASDKGLCGSFNMNVIMAVENFIFQNREKYEKIGLYILGKKIKDYFSRRGALIVKEWVELRRMEKEVISRITEDLILLCTSGEFDKVFAIYTFYRSPVKQIVTFEELIPIKAEDQEKKVDYLYEPNVSYVIEKFLPEHIRTRVSYIIFNSQTSEHASRMNAMENATNNCGEMINSLTLIYNKKRQESITKEMLDIVGGAEAVKTTSY
ncbi:MAG: ATP synthase F1 subunit gamma [Deltaproteobacteria bacterium]|nr:ATP synthase F1 subunit gamma [Deltaproteobacteria bacterium]